MLCVKVWQRAEATAILPPPQHKRFSLSALCISLLWLLALLPLTIGCQPLHHATKEGPQEPQPLSAAQPVQSTLGKNEKRAYHLSLKAGQYLRLTIEPQEIAVALTLSTPSGRQLRNLDCREVGARSLSALIANSGTYLLTVRSLETMAHSGAYHLKISELRQATAQDRHLIAAETAEASAEQLYETWEAQASRQAIRQFQTDHTLWQRLGDMQHRIHTLRGIGAAYYSLGELSTAINFYQRALALNAKLGDAQGQTETLNQMSNIYLYLAKPEEALKCATQALQLSHTVGDKLGEARALNNVGAYHDWMDEKEQALKFLEQALALCRALNDRRLLATIFLNFGYAHSDIGNAQEAFDYYARSLALWRETGHRRGEALTLTALGQLYSRVGEKQEALNRYAQAALLFKLMGNQLWEATTLGNSAYDYLALGEPQRALSNYENVLKLWRMKGFNQGVAAVLAQIGEAHYTMGNHRKALSYYQQALPLLRTFDLQRYESYALINSGRAYAALGEQQQALAIYQEALLLSRQVGNRQGEAYLLNDIGDAHRALNKQEQALEFYRQALALNQAVGDRFGESQTRYHLALLELDRTDLLAARAQIETALALSESLRAKVFSQELRTSYSASIHQYYQLQIDVLMRLHRQQPTQGYDALALAASEKARARSLLELLAEARADLRRDVEPELLQRERTLQQQLNGKAERLMRLRGEKPNEAEMAAVEREVETLTAQIDDVRALMRARSPHYAALTQPQPRDLAAIQNSVLDDDTLLLEYALGERSSYVWAVTRREIASYELASSRQIEQSARRLYDLFIARQPVANERLKQRHARLADNDAQYALAAAELSRLVLAPVAAHLGHRRLIVVSEGALQYVPFAALPEPVPSGSIGAPANAGNNGSPAAPLIVQHEIISLPSASTLAVLRAETIGREPAAKAVTVLADPVFGKDDERFSNAVKTGRAARPAAVNTSALAGAELTLPRLPATHEEAAAILSVTPAGAANLVEGFAVNRALVTGAELSQYRIIHFATHGLLDSQHPELSGVALSRFDPRGNPQDGFLRLHDIYNLKLPAELVVLSACNTALGKDVKGEGLIALTRGFMYAGAARVLASLWKVDDEATTELMKEFYQRMLHDGLTPAAALREAQLTMWRQQRAPYYWAAFVLQGEYLPSSPVLQH